MNPEGLGKTAKQIMRDKIQGATGITEARRAELLKQLEAADDSITWTWKKPKK